MEIVGKVAVAITATRYIYLLAGVLAHFFVKHFDERFVVLNH